MKRVRILMLCACILLMGFARAEGAVCVSTDAAAALLSADGSEIVAPGVYDDIFAVADGELYAFGTLTDAGMRYALGDAAGTPMTEPAYEMFKAEGDSVIFARNGLFGAMDRAGKVVVPAEYTQLIAAGSGCFLGMTTNPFDDDADEIFVLEGGERMSTGIQSDEGLSAFADGRTPFQDPATERFGYLAQDGSVAVEAQFDTAGRFEGGAARASLDGKLGLIGTDGRWLVSPEFDYLESGGGVTVGLIGRERFVVFNEGYEEAFRIEGAGLEAALVGEYPVLMRGGVLEVYNVRGELILETQQSSALVPGLNGQLILSDGDWGADCVSLVSADGVRSERRDQHLIPLDAGRYAFIEMNVASYYSEVLEEIRYSCDYDSLRWGMMDSEGTEILPAEFLEIRALGGNRYLAVDESGLRVTDETGSVLWTYAKEE